MIIAIAGFFSYWCFEKGVFPRQGYLRISPARIVPKTRCALQLHLSFPHSRKSMLIGGEAPTFDALLTPTLQIWCQLYRLILESHPR